MPHVDRTRRVEHDVGGWQVGRARQRRRGVEIGSPPRPRQRAARAGVGLHAREVRALRREQRDGSRVRLRVAQRDGRALATRAALADAAAHGVAARDRLQAHGGFLLLRRVEVVVVGAALLARVARAAARRVEGRLLAHLGSGTREARAVS